MGPSSTTIVSSKMGSFFSLSYNFGKEGALFLSYPSVNIEMKNGLFVNICPIEPWYFPLSTELQYHEHVQKCIYPVILRILGFFSSSFSRKIHHPRRPYRSPNITA